MEVALVEDLGSDSYIYGHLADDNESSVIVRSGRDHPRHGDVVKVGGGHRRTCTCSMRTAGCGSANEAAPPRSAPGP